MADKQICWIGSSKENLSSFPHEAKRKAGFRLRAIQRGQKPTDFKPIPTIGKETEEFRIWTGDAYRVLYIASFEEAIHVLHSFQKKTQKTSKKDLALGQQRDREMLQFRQTRKEG